VIKIEITIPLFYNNKEPIEQIHFTKIKRELLRQFGALTISNQCDGYWTQDNKLYEDINRIYTIICEPTKDNLSYIRGYKKWLEHQLEQESIFIVVTKCEVIE
jgi:hypothetical protein